MADPNQEKKVDLSCHTDKKAEKNSTREISDTSKTEASKFNSRQWKKMKIIAALCGCTLAALIIAVLYMTGCFSRAPPLPDSMDGDAELVTAGGRHEKYKLYIDYKRQIIQMNYLHTSKQTRRERRSSYDAFVQLNVSKIIVEDFKKKKKYFIVPAEGNTTLKCWTTELIGEMIPKDLLNLLKSGKVTQDLKDKYFKHYKFSDGAEVQVTTSASEVEKVVIRSPNASLILGNSQNSSFHLIDLDQVKCFAFNELTGKIDENFENSSQINFELDQVVKNAFNLTQDMVKLMGDAKHAEKQRNITDSSSKRKRVRRKIDWGYGTWCGPKYGGYVNHCAVNGKCGPPYDKVSHECQTCTTPIDALDRDCMEHDRCLKEAGNGPKACIPQGNRCTCDFKLAYNAIKRSAECLISGNTNCLWSAQQIAFVFTKLLSCWFPTTICFPTVALVCHCSQCSCPALKTSYTCMDVKFCVPFGSGKVYW